MKWLDIVALALLSGAAAAFTALGVYIALR